MIKYGLHNRLTAVPGKRDELASILLEASRLVAKSKGCQIYVVSRDPSDPDSVCITEVWDSREDHDDSLRNDLVRQLIGKAMPLLAGMPEKGQQLEVLGGLGV